MAGTRSDETATATTNAPPAHQSKWLISYFDVLLTLTQFFGFSMICLSAYYFNTVKWGLEWPKNGENPESQDSQSAADYFHGFFMQIGLVFFQGEALLSYRLYRYDLKLISKFIHFVFHCLAIGFFITAFVCIVLAKKYRGEGHFGTFHSWFGLVVMFIYAMQFLFGFINFYFPGSPLKVRAQFMPYHRIIGGLSFVMCTIQVIIGHTQLSAWDGGNCFYDLSCKSGIEFVYIALMFTLVAYGITVMCCIIPPKWRRQKTPDEMK